MVYQLQRIDPCNLKKKKKTLNQKKLVKSTRHLKYILTSYPIKTKQQKNLRHI